MRRILPPLLVVILATLLVGWVWLLPFDFRVLSKEAAASALYVFNFLLWHESGYFDVASGTKPLLHLWSLAVEEQFYLVWPAFLLLAYWCKRRTDLAILGILLVSFLVNLLTVQGDQTAAFYSPLSRLWELAAGGLLVQLACRRSRSTRQCEARCHAVFPTHCRSIAGLVLILGAALLYTSRSQFPGYLAAVPVLGAVLIVAGGERAWLNRAVLARGPMVHVGKLSYSLYLWHWPVLVLATLLYTDQHFRYLPGACLVLSILLAWGTYYWVERPIRRLAVNPTSAWRFLALGIGASLTIAAFAWLTSAGILARPADAGLITKDYQRPENGCTFAGLSAPEAASGPCSRLAKSSKHRGDRSWFWWVIRTPMRSMAGCGPILMRAAST